MWDPELIAMKQRALVSQVYGELMRDPELIAMKQRALVSQVYGFLIDN